MDDTYRTGALVPHQDVRYAFTRDMNHRFTPEFAFTRPLWFDQHLKGSFTLPKTPGTHPTFGATDHVPLLEVRPDASQDVTEIHVYYSVDPDPRARFWRSADVTMAGDGLWTGRLPILSVNQPLLAFANVVNKVKKSESEPYAKPTERFALSSTLHTVTSQDLAASGATATDKADPVIDDFAHRWQDWYTLSAHNPHHWEFSTRKLADPKWPGRDGQRLTVEVKAEKPNDPVIVLTENMFRSYRGKQRKFVAVARLGGGKNIQIVSLRPKDFQASDGESLASWQNIDLLSFRAYHDNGGKLLGSKSSVGPQPVISKLWWQADGK